MKIKQEEVQFVSMGSLKYHKIKEKSSIVSLFLLFNID